MLRDVTTFQHGNGMNIQAFLDTYGKFFKNSRKQREVKRLDHIFIHILNIYNKKKKESTYQPEEYQILDLKIMVLKGYLKKH